MLNKTHFRILRQLSLREYESVTKLSRDLNSTTSNIDMALNTLVDFGLVEMNRIGKRVHVRISEKKHAQEYRKIIALYPHMRIEEILTGRNIEIIINLLRNPCTISTLADNLKVSTRTILRSIKILSRFGIIRTNNGLYSVNIQYTDIYNFIKELQSYVNLKLAQVYGQSVTLIWDNLDEFIVESMDPIEFENYSQTGYTELARFGIPLLTGQRLHFFYSLYKSELRLEDICIHILAINPVNARTILYVVLAILKNETIWDWQYIMHESQIYHINDLMERIKMYIETQGKITVAVFPSWKELKEKALGYDIYV